MFDIHCHILPGIDDGAYNMDETVQMFSAAKSAGIATMIATPHYRSNDAETGIQIKRIYDEVRIAAEQRGIRLLKGAEINHRVLADHIGDWLDELTLGNTNCVLVEFSSGSLPMLWENRIAEIQGRGLEVIIAHPERYIPVQEDITVARRMVEIGCELQVSADFIGGGLFSKRRKCAVELLKKGWVSYIASDAHCTEDYVPYAAAMKKYGGMLCGGMLNKIV